MPQPLQTWLSQSYLTQIADKSCVLIVDKDNEEIVQQLSYLQQIYPLVKSLYPDVKSLYISSNDFKEFIKTGKIEIYSVEKI